MKVPQAIPHCGLTLALPHLQAAQPDFAHHATPVSPAPPDPAIASALKTIEPAHIEQTIKTLVGFGTRNTLSSMDTDLPPGQGINAAADWIVAQFDADLARLRRLPRGQSRHLHGRSGQRRPWARRIPQPTHITNVYAILRGADPAQAKRMVLVTGHYDSRQLQRLDWALIRRSAGSQRRCLRSRRLARVRPRAEQAAFSGNHRLRRRGRRRAGTHRLRAILPSWRETKGWQLEAVLNNDIVGGNTTPGDNLQLKDRVRVFSEGVPLAATPEQARRIRALGEENDSPSRELARAVADTARTYFPAVPAPTRDVFTAFLVVPARPLPARRRPQLVQPRGFCRRPLHRVARRLQPPAPERRSAAPRLKRLRSLAT